MPVNAVNQVQPKAPTNDVMQNKPAVTDQANLFSSQLDANKTNSTLQHAADDSGLSSLAEDANTGNWHSVMGQTYGYDQNDSNGEAYQQSESIRESVRDSDWSSLDVDVASTQGNIGSEAAFVGGDTAAAGDDKILLNGDPNNSSSDAVTEELFHAFERKINAGQEGDTRLENGVVNFTASDSASALDEGELGRSLLSEFNKSGNVPTVSDDLLNTGGISADDTSIVSLDGQSVSVENLELEPIPEPGSGPEIIITPETNPIVGAVESLDADHNSIFAAIEASSREEINDAFTYDDGAVIFAGDGSRDYSTKSGFYDDIINVTDPTAMEDYLTLESGLFNSQGVQDFLAYAARHDPDTASGLGRSFDQAPADSLEKLSFEDLNYDDVGDGTRPNPELLQHASIETLLSLSDEIPGNSSDTNLQQNVGNKAAGQAVQDAIQLKADADPAGTKAAIQSSVGGIEDFAARFTPTELENFAPVFTEIYDDPNTDAGRKLSDGGTLPGGEFTWLAQASYEDHPVGYSEEHDLQTWTVVANSNDGGGAIFNDPQDGNTWTLWQSSENELAVGLAGTNPKDIGDLGRDIQSATKTDLSGYANVNDGVLAGSGWAARYEAQRDNLAEAINDIDPLHAEQISFAGHSLGAASAQTFGMLWALENPQQDVHVEAYNTPRVGNTAFAEQFQGLIDETEAAGPNSPFGKFTAEQYNVTGDAVSWIRTPLSDTVHAQESTVQADRVSWFNILTNHSADNWVAP